MKFPSDAIVQRSIVSPASKRFRAVLEAWSANAVPPVAIAQFVRATLPRPTTAWIASPPVKKSVSRATNVGRSTAVWNGPEPTAAETGSVLSHLAILAREAGVATVVGYAGAMNDLPEGAIVRVDGENGQVCVQEENA